MARDPYTELGLQRGASDDDVRAAYRKLAKDLHPDARPGDAAAEERFKRVTAAFAILSDPEQRRRYDAGEIDADGNAQAGYDYRGGGYRGSGGRGPDRGEFDDLGDILSGVFGDGAGRRGGRPFSSKGGDVRYRLEVTFEEAAIGGRKRVVMGDGRSLDLVVPEGVNSGQVLRLRGQGRPGPGGGAPGDALVELAVAEHPFYRREGADIHVELPVTVKEAALGAKVRTPTLTGPVTVTIPKGSNSGAVLRLRGKGVKGESARGDQLVRLVIKLPERPDAELTRFLEDWDAPESYNPRADLGV